MTSNGMVTRESASLLSRSALVVFSLAAGFAYRASVSLIPPGLFEDAFLLGLAALLLIVAVLARRSRSRKRYWEIPFAFFVFTVAGFLGDVAISPLQQWFVHDVLHETPSVHNPLASTVVGTVLAQVFGTLSLALPIILLTIASGSSLSALFLTKQRNWVWLLVSIIGFLVFFSPGCVRTQQGVLSQPWSDPFTLSCPHASTPRARALQWFPRGIMVQRALPEKVWQVSLAIRFKSARRPHLHLVSCPGPVQSESADFSRCCVDPGIDPGLSDAKIRESSRACDFPCRH
jgi:hypothetical protein